MLLPGHLGASYLVAAAGTRLRRRPGATPRPVTLALALFALGAGLASDADILPMLLRVGWDPLGRVASEHRASILHTPLFALAFGLATLALPLRDRWLWATVGGAAVIVHLLLDSLSIGSGVMWLHPWSDAFYGLNLANTRYGRDWGDQWLWRYLAHPLFLLEVALVAAAAVVARRQRTFGRAS
jgi:membrane-bound metal-dependent hydrolase YbcI (DUF457 family)